MKQNQVQMDERFYKQERQKIYRNLLDDQVKEKPVPIPSLIRNTPLYKSQEEIYNERRNYPTAGGEFYSPQLNRKEIDDHSYQFKNNVISVNPCKYIELK
jgi:hypothetical protein